MAGDGLTWDAPTQHVQVRLAATAGNGLTIGSDGGLWAAQAGTSCSAVQDALAGAWGRGLVWDAGSRLVNVRISSDAGNRVRYGTDGGLYAGAPSPGPWTLLGSGPLLNGWTLGSPAPRWRRLTDGLIQWSGRLVAGTKTANTVMVTLPAGTTPTTTMRFMLAATKVATTVSMANIEVTTTQLRFAGQLGNCATVSLDQLRYYID
ncbi:hypothetical protein ACQEVF_57410 [Nonomuraea polychroma]|uniref:hypothetical protein n=1 Tax=Nonomuraea polychroma TaxID=46176 RepID=UPI003D8F3DB0